jgi:excisionase family DNA binding protein
MKDKNLLSTVELAKLIGISRIAVYKRIKKGKIKAKKVGHNFIIDVKDSGDILGKELNRKEKLEIKRAVKKTIKEYGETLKMLGTT